MSANLLLVGLLSAAPASPSPLPPTAASGPVIFFLVDNSASLPPLDPQEKRVVALEKMFGFLEGQPYRLILFGGRSEIFVDDVSRYRNNGQWTDFYFGFERARALMGEYPRGTDFRMILVTDAIPDPKAEDWEGMEVPKDEPLKRHAAEKTLALIREMRVPLYVILVGDIPAGVDPGQREQAPGLVLDMVRAANGAAAAPLAQTLSSFFDDDGVLLKKFVYRVAPQEGLKKIEPVVRRIVAPARPRVELQFLSGLVLPVVLLLALVLGIAVRSYPGPGDVEIVELSKDSPVHVSADKLHKLDQGGWGTTGLCLAQDAKSASATLAYQASPLDLTAAGLETQGLDPLTLRLLPMGFDELRRALEDYSENGSKEEKIHALNLDYMAKNLDPSEAERVLGLPAAQRGTIAPVDFLRAKVHALSNEPLRRKLTESRVQLVSYGKAAERKSLAPGVPLRIGRYGFVVKELASGGRKDARLVLYYDRVPSLLGLKSLLPDRFQRLFRMRRSRQRLVS